MLIKTILASNLLCIYNRIGQLCETEHQVPTPRPAEDEEQIDLEPEQLTSIAQQQQKSATSSRRFVLQHTQHHETLIRRASEQAVFATTVEKGQIYITNDSVMDGNSSTPLWRENTQNQ